MFGSRLANVTREIAGSMVKRRRSSSTFAVKRVNEPSISIPAERYSSA